MLHIVLLLTKHEADIYITVRFLMSYSYMIIARYLLITHSIRIDNKSLTNCVTVFKCEHLIYNCQCQLVRKTLNRIFSASERWTCPADTPKHKCPLTQAWFIHSTAATQSLGVLINNDLIKLITQRNEERKKIVAHL